MGRLPESSARKTEATRTEREERAVRRRGRARRWEEREERSRGQDLPGVVRAGSSQGRVVKVRTSGGR